jgi:hypothetical protein
MGGVEEPLLIKASRGHAASLTVSGAEMRLMLDLLDQVRGMMIVERNHRSITVRLSDAINYAFSIDNETKEF